MASAARDDTVAPTGLPRLERPSRAHALRFARILFTQGERVDMQALASALGVGRTTLYRWVGDREQLIGEVLAELSASTWRIAAEQATGRGLNRGLDTIRRFMEITGAYEPLRSYAQREPESALRVLMDEHGAIARHLRDGFAHALDDNRTDSDPEIGRETVEIMVQLATALEWAPIVIGQPPAIDRAIHLMRALIQTSPAPRRRAE